MTSSLKDLRTEMDEKDEQIANLTAGMEELRGKMIVKDEQIANLTAGMKVVQHNINNNDAEMFKQLNQTTEDINELKACACVPKLLFDLSSQVHYPTSYTYPAAYETRPLIPALRYFDVIDISSRISIAWKYSGGVLAPNGHIYMVSYKADNIGDFVPSTNTFDVIDISSRISISWKYRGGVLAPNGHIYMVPSNADNIGDMTLGNTEPAYAVGGGVPEEWSSLLSPHFNKF